MVLYVSGWTLLVHYLVLFSRIMEYYYELFVVIPGCAIIFCDQSIINRNWTKHDWSMLQYKILCTYGLFPLFSLLVVTNRKKCLLYFIWHKNSHYCLAILLNGYVINEKLNYILSGLLISCRLNLVPYKMWNNVIRWSYVEWFAPNLSEVIGRQSKINGIVYRRLNRTQRTNNYNKQKIHFLLFLFIWF